MLPQVKAYVDERIKIARKELCDEFASSLTKLSSEVQRLREKIKREQNPKETVSVAIDSWEQKYEKAIQ